MGDRPGRIQQRHARASAGTGKTRTGITASSAPLYGKCALKCSFLKIWRAQKLECRMNEDDEFSKLSAEDRAKLALLEQEFERDGDVAVERFAENDPAFMLRILECFNPRAVRDATENHL